MLKTILNLLPAKIVKSIGDSSFANLSERQEIKTWIVQYTKNSSLLETNDSQPTPLEK